MLDFPSKKRDTSALLIFASGDGGWGGLEEAIGRAFQNQGYEVIGIDSEAYAESDYDLDILQSDFTALAEAGQAPFGSHPVPLIVGGYSMARRRPSRWREGPIRRPVLSARSWLTRAVAVATTACARRTR